MVLVINKTDVMSLDDASEEIQAAIRKYEADGNDNSHGRVTHGRAGVKVLQMSALTEEGVAHVRNTVGALSDADDAHSRLRLVISSWPTVLTARVKRRSQTSNTAFTWLYPPHVMTRCAVTNL